MLAAHGRALKSKAPAGGKETTPPAWPLGIAFRRQADTATPASRYTRDRARDFCSDRTEAKPLLRRA